MLPPELVASLYPGRAALIACEETPIPTLGAATGAVHRLRATLDVAGERNELRLIRKRLRPLTSGRHIAANSDRSHWAYWRREPLAYESGLLPDGPDLSAPRYIGTIDHDLYTEEIVGVGVAAVDAALALGRWQRGLRLPGRSWLAGHQLAQRLAVTTIDTTSLDPAWRAVWEDRWRYLDALDRLPYVLSHGDSQIGNFLSAEDGIVLCDWGTLGGAPVGADAAHVALSVSSDVLDDYVRGLRGAVDAATVALGYTVTIVLTGISRAHWHVAAGHDYPASARVFLDAAITRLTGLLSRP
ncbi:aminoglycoside phosphotransferase family protein [Stackebrandtia soli]|uniref:aminoglycoside phosphotransferase family protein n=1 Tax=Stackebrandtia soli TaxID=1892856 RepID=UPI0039EB70E7